MLLYHYTSTLHLPLILKSRVISTTHNALHPTDQLGEPVVWLTASDVFEAQLWAAGILDKTAIRLSIEIPRAHVQPWQDFARAQGADPVWLAVLAEVGGGDSDWYVSTRPIDWSAVVAVDARENGGYQALRAAGLAAMLNEAD
ncbi:hypothetical protein J2T57_001675 [Natronocella acetinitrilica]|uniref:Uncharacterized protein n=1 Tax=Natronocella acetinitrilica TaxID=414046 RepID=A0AAE3G3M0_9GAMM|nr:hypothetical protein [Natronocella acetinitrilica]MCP1674573.1 hypothetical protein [Natronocella acetinitrilica]